MGTQQEEKMLALLKEKEMEIEKLQRDIVARRWQHASFISETEDVIEKIQSHLMNETSEQKQILSDLLREVEQENEALKERVALHIWERDMLKEDLKGNQSDFLEEKRVLITHYKGEIDELRQENCQLSLQNSSPQPRIPVPLELDPNDPTKEIPFEKDIYTLEDFAIMQKGKAKGKARVKKRAFAVRSSPLGETSRQF